MHEEIVDLDKATDGLIEGYIVINETRLGPALGGTRIAAYPNKEAALIDAQRLASMMSKKTLMAGLPFGGGKGVIRGNAKAFRTPEHLQAYAEVVKSLKGKFYTGEDVGLEEKDVQYMLQFSPYFIGKTGLAGDPSSFAAQSAFLCIKTAIKKLFETHTCSGLTFAVKGLGKTGSVLAGLIHNDGGMLYVADADPIKVSRILDMYPGTQTIPSSEIHTAPAQVFVPCALGDDVTTQTINFITAKLICGTANNQLENPAMNRELHARKIIHVPDYIANAGGVINVADELMPHGYSLQRVEKEIHNLATVLERVWTKAEQNNTDLDTAAEMEIDTLLQAG